MAELDEDWNQVQPVANRDSFDSSSSGLNNAEILGFFGVSLRE